MQITREEINKLADQLEIEAPEDRTLSGVLSEIIARVGELEDAVVAIEDALEEGDDEAPEETKQ